MRRKIGSLVPLEVSILEAAAELQIGGQAEVHGYRLASAVRDMRDARRLTAYGTLYKALGRLEREGFLASRWEDPNIAAADGRPRRRFYRLTTEGEGALVDARGSTSAVRASRGAATSVT